MHQRDVLCDYYFASSDWYKTLQLCFTGLRGELRLYGFILLITNVSCIHSYYDTILFSALNNYFYSTTCYNDWLGANDSALVGTCLVNFRRRVPFLEILNYWFGYVLVSYSSTSSTFVISTWTLSSYMWSSFSFTLF